MSSGQEFLLDHGYAVLFLWVLAEQIGLPIPSTPMLLAAGALIGLHRMNLAAVLGLAAAASLISDSVWFLLGKERGDAVLATVCGMSLDPDHCVSKTHSVFSRYGPESLLFAKFVPGFGTLGPPVAGLLDLPPWKFLLLDLGGALAWSGAYVTLGWALRAQLEDLAVAASRVGSFVVVALVAGLAILIGIECLRRRRLYSTFRMERVSPAELKQRMDAGEKLTIVDLRASIEWRDGRIPGSIQGVDQNLKSLPAEILQAEVILYCSSFNEAQSARVAVRLRRQGVQRVRPLEGGFAKWRALGFPVEGPAPGTVLGT